MMLGDQMLLWLHMGTTPLRYPTRKHDRRYDTYGDVEDPTEESRFPWYRLHSEGGPDGRGGDDTCKLGRTKDRFLTGTDPTVRRPRPLSVSFSGTPTRPLRPPKLYRRGRHDLRGLGRVDPGGGEPHGSSPTSTVPGLVGLGSQALVVPAAPPLTVPCRVECSGRVETIGIVGDEVGVGWGGPPDGKGLRKPQTDPLLPSFVVLTSDFVEKGKNYFAVFIVLGGFYLRRGGGQDRVDQDPGRITGWGWVSRREEDGDGAGGGRVERSETRHRVGTHWGVGSSSSPSNPLHSFPSSLSALPPLSPLPSVPSPSSWFCL